MEGMTHASSSDKIKVQAGLQMKLFRVKNFRNGRG